jgi:hypothetical protein
MGEHCERLVAVGHTMLMMELPIFKLMLHGCLP